MPRFLVEWTDSRSGQTYLHADDYSAAERHVMLNIDQYESSVESVLVEAKEVDA